MNKIDGLSREVFCQQCGAAILVDAGEGLDRCPFCGRDPSELSPAKKAEAAKEAARIRIAQATSSRNAAAVRPSQPPAVLKSPGVAAVLSFVIPGLGQVYNGQLAKGILVFGTFLAGLLFLVLPGVLVWAAGIYDAYECAERFNRGE